jgi:O-antigen/teichoic acid export membrane protein
LSVLLVAAATGLGQDYFSRLGITYDLVILLGLGNLCIFPQKTYTSLIREKRAFPYMAKASLTTKVLLLVGVCVLFVSQVASMRAYLVAVLISRLCHFGFMVHFISLYKTVHTGNGSIFSNGCSAFMNPFRFWNDSSYSDYWYFLKMGFLTSTLSGLIKNGSDMLLIGHFGTATDVGHYKLAKSLAEKVQLAPALLAPYYFQDFSEWVVRGEYEKLRGFLKRVARYWSPTVVVVCLVAFVACKPLILALFGDDSFAAVNHFRILLAGIFIQIVLFWVQPLVLSLKLLTAQLLGVLFVTIGYFTIILCTNPLLGVYSISSALAFAWGGGYLYLLLTLQRKRDLLFGV